MVRLHLRLCPRQRVPTRPTTSPAIKNPAMVPAEMEDANHAPRDVVMAEVRVAVKDVATGVAAAAEQIVVVSVVLSARLALTVQVKTSRASDWTQTATLC